MARTKRSTKGRAKAPGKLTAKQEEVKRLLDVGQSIVEIAEMMETTPGAVKAQISRIRKLGVKVEAHHPRVTAPEIAGGTDALPEGQSALAAAVDAASPTVEELIAAELATTDERLSVVGTTIADLTEEQANLGERKGRLEAARAELVPGGDRPLSVVA